MSRWSFLIAGGLVLGVAGWLASGVAFDDDVTPRSSPRAEIRIPLVEVADSRARSVATYVTARGDVRAFRRAAARTEAAGRIAEVVIRQGERVEQGATLMQLTLEGRDSRLREARAVLEQRQKDYEAAAKLLEDGYQTQQRVRELETLLQGAREEVQRLEEEVEDAVVKAPFSGIVDTLGVEPGEYLAAGADAAILIDNTPLRTEVRVSQQDVSKIELGREVTVSYATGQAEAGRICFVSAAADPQTRTFRVEIRTPNADGDIPSGISAETRIPTAEIRAHLVSPAILSLGTDGALGLKAVDGEGVVAFYPVEVVRASTDGVWVSGLPDEARIITTGQGFVRAGDQVRVADSTAEEPEVRPNASDSPTDAPRADVQPNNTVPADICEREPARAPSAPAVASPAEEEGEATTEAGETSAAVMVADGSRQDLEANSAEGGNRSEQAALMADPPVAAVQQALNRLGFDAGPADGAFGARTRAALRDFQQHNGLPATGELDRASFDRLMGRAGGGEEERS